MLTYILSYVFSLVAFLAMDFVWLSLMHKPLYKAQLGPLLLDKPHWGAAALFYLAYAVGVAVFAVLPALRAHSGLRALWGGALLGFIAYGTYNLTNLATLNGWSLQVSLTDLSWGTFATGVAATVAFFLLRFMVG